VPGNRRTICDEYSRNRRQASMPHTPGPGQDACCRRGAGVGPALPFPFVSIRGTWTPSNSARVTSFQLERTANSCKPLKNKALQLPLT
jgi:hypothetical protein